LAVHIWLFYSVSLCPPTQCLNDAHKSQTELLQMEARGEHIDIGFITVHAQDHLMTTILLKDIINNLLDIYR